MNHRDTEDTEKTEGRKEKQTLSFPPSVFSVSSVSLWFPLSQSATLIEENAVFIERNVRVPGRSAVRVAAGDVSQCVSRPRLHHRDRLPRVHEPLPHDGAAGLRHHHVHLHAGRVVRRTEVAEAVPAALSQSGRLLRDGRQSL